MPDPVSQYLQSRNITDADTATRLRNAFASNPDILERRMLAGGGRNGARGVEDTFDQMIAATLDPPGRVEVGVPTKIEDNAAPAPSPIRPKVKGPGEVAGTDAVTAREATGSPLQKGGIPGDENAPRNDPAKSDWTDWLWPLLGLAAARNPIAGASAAGPRGITPFVGPEATYVGPMNRNDPRFGGYLPTNRPELTGPNPQLEAPQGRVTSNVGPNVESIGNEIDTVNQRNSTMKNAREAQIRQDVADENAALRRMMEQQELQRRAQRSTRELGDAAKRATGRR